MSFKCIETATQDVHIYISLKQTENYLEGSAMGGGTSVNGFQFYKGSREDFDRWSDLGNVGWDYDSVLPFYKKSEDYKGSVLPGSGETLVMLF